MACTHVITERLTETVTKTTTIADGRVVSEQFLTA